MSLDEFEIIARYFTRPTEDPDVLLGIGDDAAVVQASGSVVIATDTLVEGVHFPGSLGGEAGGDRRARAAARCPDAISSTRTPEPPSANVLAATPRSHGARKEPRHRDGPLPRER